MNFEAEKRRRIIEYASAHPQKRQIDIARDLGVARATVQRALRTFVKDKNKTQKIIDYIKETNSDITEEIHRATGISHDLIRKVAKQYGYKLRTRSQVLHEQIKDYVTVHPEGYTLNEIAESCSCAVPTVRRILYEFEDDGFRCLHLLKRSRSRSPK